jgi:hypothetical protein
MQKIAMIRRKEKPFCEPFFSGTVCERRWAAVGSLVQSMSVNGLEGRNAFLISCAYAPFI